MSNNHSVSGHRAEGGEDRLPLLLSFLLPVVVMLGVFAGKEIFPFGDESFLRTDMYHQYAPFFADFARVLKEGGSLTYSTEIGLGSNFVALYAYYLSSPFNWLLALVPAGGVIEFMTYLIVFKIGLCGLTTGIYLKKKFHRNDLAIPAIAVCYALSGYMAAYSWNIMWLDCLWLAPLILLGLENLVRKNQPFPYCIALGLGIISNYYIAIMLCIFMVLYFICEMILLPRLTVKEYLTKLLLFGLFSLLAGGLSAFLLLPAYRCLMTTASADSTFPSSLTSYFSVLEMLARHMVNVDVEIGLEHWPNLYSGVGCMVLLPLYLIHPRIPAKEKIVKTSLLAVMLVSFSFNIPNFIWHGMHYPNSLPCRQSFLYTLVLLAMCYEGLRYVRELTRGQIVGCFWGTAAFILLCEKLITAPEFHYYVYYLTLLFVALYSLLIYLARERRLRGATACILALGILVLETGMNTAITSVTTVNRTEYWKNTENYRILVEQAGDRDTSGFFRVEKPSRRTKNDGAWTDYQSASIFSSTTQSSISDFYKTFGLEGNTNAYSFTGATPLMSSLLSVRFLISATDLEEDPLYEQIGWQGTASLYENKYTLPLGFMIPEGVGPDFEYGKTDDPPEAQNELVAQTTGGAPVLVEIADNGSYDSFDFEVEEAGRIFVWVDNSSIETVSGYINEVHKTFNNVDRGYLLDLGQCEKGDEISLSSDDDAGYTMYATAYRFDEEAFIDWYETLARQGMTVTDYTNKLWRTEIIGDVTAEQDAMLFLSIPYDTGWEVLVDGEHVETQAFADSFLMLPLTAGTHAVDMIYHVPGLTEGFLLTLSALVILAVLATLVMLRSHKRKPQLPRYRGGSRSAQNGSLPVSEPEKAEEPEEDMEEEARSAQEYESDGMTEEEMTEILLEDEEFLEAPVADPEAKSAEETDPERPEE